MQTALPCSTSRWQKSDDSSGGRIARSCVSTFAGSLPSESPRRFVMRMQCVSQTTEPDRQRFVKGVFFLSSQTSSMIGDGFAAWGFTSVRNFERDSRISDRDWEIASSVRFMASST